MNSAKEKCTEMIIPHEKENFPRKAKETKCFKTTFRFIGRMTCKEVGMYSLLIVGMFCIVLWSLKSSTGIANSIGKKDHDPSISSEENGALKVGDDSSNIDVVRKTLGIIDESNYGGSDLNYRIQELLRIKTSVQKELHALEEQRSLMQQKVTKLTYSLKNGMVKNRKMYQNITLNISSSDRSLL